MIRLSRREHFVFVRAGIHTHAFIQVHSVHVHLALSLSLSLSSKKTKNAHYSL